jgi:hypothetical protein
MSNRFAPNLAKLNRIVDELVAEGGESRLIDAFSKVSDPSLGLNSVDELKRHLRTQLIVEKIPWVFYDAITDLLQHSHESLERFIVETLRIKTESSGEYPECESLRITLDGRWQVSWEIDPDAEEADDREVALDWYTPPEIDVAPIVPDHIVDYVGGCVTLLRKGLTLPAAAVLLVAFESALWDGLALAEEGSRLSESIKYETVTWKIKRRAHCLIIEELEGADRELSEIDEVIGDYPPTFDLAVERMQSSPSAQEINLQGSVDASIVGFLTSSHEINREEHADKGLRNAMEKGRSVELECLSPLPVALDNILIALRNNLAHLPFQHNLCPAVPIPSGGELRTVEDLRETELIKRLLPWTVEVINSAYAPRWQLGDSGTEDES